MENIPNKVLVTGAGRSGTSAFMKFLYEYIDTDLLISKQNSSHYDIKSKDMSYNANLTREWNLSSNAGLEYIIEKNSSKSIVDGSPYIFKDPRICVTLDWICKKRIFNVEHVFVLIRDYKKSALSRQDKDMWWLEYSSIRCANPNKSTLSNQVDFNQRMIGKLMEAISIYDIPHTIINFPKFVENKEYLYEKLKGTPLQIKKEKMNSAFNVLEKKQVNF